MDVKNPDPYDIDSDGTIFGMVVGLGIVTLTLFPFVLPGLALLAVFALPVLVLPALVAVPIALLAIPVLAVRALRRRRRAARRPRAAALGESTTA